MRRPPVEPLCRAIEDSGSRLAALLRSVDDSSPIAVGTWTIGETANHVAGSAAHFLAVATGEMTPGTLADVDDANARALAADPERDPTVLAGRAADGERALVAHARSLTGDAIVTLFTGVDVPFSTLLGIELGEILVHGWDIARAADRQWRISPDHAALALWGYTALLPHMLDARSAAGVRLATELRIRGTPRVVARIADGELRIEEAGRQPVDCRITADPVAYLLLTWSRISPVGAALRGRMVPWGRRPWRALEFGSLLRT